ncbi:MAG: hypothetical protein K2L54_04380 [Clostridiales bacterium]|nr:hypothetical protein [Clostridiales bacterium]
MTSKDDIIKSVVKRACGYSAKEVVEEYAVVDGSLELVKRRVTTKDVPPDIAAAKMALESDGTPDLTDEQLQAEKERLLKMIRDSDLKDRALW